MEINNYFLAIVAIFILLWCYGTYINGHFSRHGIKTLPAWPLFGNMLMTILRKEHITDLLKKIYYKFQGQKYVGFYMFFQRLVIINDPDLIKQITVKDFDHFADHFVGVDESIDPIFGNILFSMKGQKWREMRATLSPVFTSSKMRNMFELVTDCAETMTHFYMKEMEKTNHEIIELEMRNVYTRFANDVIATTAFGIKVDTHFERDNEFYKMGVKATTFTTLRILKFFMFAIASKLSKILRLKLFDEETLKFFRNLVMDNIKIREEGKVYRPDLIQLLVDAKKGTLKHNDAPEIEMKEAGYATVEESDLGKQTVQRKWSDDEITAQAMVFFLTGFDAISTFLSFVAHELAVNPDVQEKLQKEIDKVVAKNNGKLNYNDLQNMKYMDMVVSETLRMWPQPSLDRKCIKPYTLPPASDRPGQKGYQINVGDAVWVPTYAIHHDPKYFPNPEKFDPERFSDDNKGSIQPFTFIPFGVGPRNCIASRFALMTTKAMIFHILAKFDYTVISKTPIPMKLSKNSFNMYAENGFWVGLKQRSQNQK